MPELVEVVFRSGGKVYSFDPAGLELKQSDQVIVRTSRGIEMGRVVVANHEVPASEITSPLEKVVRLATTNDVATAERNEKLADRAARVCEEKIVEYGLDMRLISAEVVFDGGKIIVSFFAEERVDFRRLVEDLAKKFRTRIEFRQVGVRDEARLIGGYGPCGRRMCCTMFAGDQQPVSIKMAKEQNLPLNPMKISGICGRLMCCLKYEQECYKDFKQKAPGKGTMVSTEKGEGRIVDFLVPKQKVLVDLGESGQVEASLEELQPPGSRDFGGGRDAAHEPKPREGRIREPRGREGKGKESGGREPRGRGSRGRDGKPGAPKGKEARGKEPAAAEAGAGEAKGSDGSREGSREGGRRGRSRGRRKR